MSTPGFNNGSSSTQTRSETSSWDGFDNGETFGVPSLTFKDGVAAKLKWFHVPKSKHFALRTICVPDVSLELGNLRW